ncbi:MAG: shikimate kinase [Proteobacteria bacterium]|nr:shikimate kinase [Pseudomonadota bacterium]
MNSIDPGESGPNETTGEITGQNGPRRSIVLVGLMGAGKTCIGRRLASRLACPFVDADAEIEKAAGCTIEDIFESHGEAAFRDGERRVIARILDGSPVVLATGGGAYMNEETRAKIRQQGISVWIRAELDLLLRRTSRRNNRPLLKRGDRRQIMGTLMAERYPVYAEADLTVDSKDGPPDETVEAVLRALNERSEDRPNRQEADPAGIAQ